jgi:tetratricopeptide (TPR) repeat protein
MPGDDNKDNFSAIVKVRAFALQKPPSNLAQRAIQDFEWDSLNKEALELYRTGQSERAVFMAKQVLEVAEKNPGLDHDQLTISLNNLAWFYKTQGQYAQAEPLYKRALAIAEKALGPDHPDVVMILSNLAWFYKTQGQYAQAEPLYKRALAIAEKALGPDHPDVVMILSNLAWLYKTQGQYAQQAPPDQLIVNDMAEITPTERLTLDDMADAIMTLGGSVEQDPATGFWFLYIESDVVRLDTTTKDGAIRAAWKYIILGPSA